MTSIVAVKNKVRVCTSEYTTSAEKKQVFLSDRTTRTIPLSQGKVAIVDDADYTFLSQHKWYALKSRYTYYAMRHSLISESKQGPILMHRVILNMPETAETDHINGNGLDNRRVNLRVCSTAQNQWSQRLRCDNKTRFKGVRFMRNVSKKPFRATIGVNKKQIHLGCYQTAKEAARAYDAAALKYYGRFAMTNKMLGLLPKRPRPKHTEPDRVGVAV